MEKQAVAELPSIHQAALSSPINRTNFLNILVEHKDISPARDYNVILRATE